MRDTKFGIECLSGIAGVVFFYAVFIMCFQMKVIISDKNILYVTLQLFLLPLAVIWLMRCLFKKIKAEERYLLHRFIIMVIYMANLLCVGETLLHTRRIHILQVTAENVYLKAFIILYIVFCLVMWVIQVVKMLNALKVNEAIEKGLERLLGDD